MKKNIVLIFTASALGIIVMLIPVAVFTPFFITAKDNQEGSPHLGNGSTPTTIQRIDEAAQTYGKIDAGPVSFPTSLFHVTLIVATCFLTAFVIAQYFKRRIK